MQLAYYPGCTIKASARQHEQAALAILRALGVELREMAEWNCCGVVHTLTSANLIRHMAPVRVLARLRQQGAHEVVTLCDMCFNTLARANLLARQQPEQFAAISASTDSELRYDGDASVLHLLQVLRDRVGLAALRARVRRPLRELRVYPYYGCKLLRPSTVGIDDPEIPTLLRDLLEALGATVIEGHLQTRCCGAYQAVDQPELVAERVTATAAQARAGGAEAIVLSCPLCHFNFDTLQPRNGAPLPVFYYTQVIGLAFGLEPEELGLETRQIDQLPPLRQRDRAQAKGGAA
ncbi:MAG: CoB--CoM heterodisulfide reductase iron-sulfur subunit B family protein [Chloroflexi bacterium]|nr:CoB--CoM heterodisulfide reductase iron-sulfur subunit B family protein [Chloroflexota bacterium]